MGSMRTNNRMLLLALTLALAVTAVAAPATAFAQSAGDDQYVDPFQDDGSGGGNQGDSGSQGGSDNSVAQAPADSSDTAGASAGAADANDGSSLPRTGLMVGGVALMGVILLGGGYLLRRVWPRPD
jgi:hypothetical protein